MFLKYLGSLLVIVGCGAGGFRIAAKHRLEEQVLRELIRIIDYMECELSFRLTSLPELCRCAVGTNKGTLKKFFSNLANELETQVSPDVDSCVSVVLKKNDNLSETVSEMLKLLGNTLGRFDLQGQLNGFASVKQEAIKHLEQLSEKNKVQLRSYQTLGLCAGATLAVIFL